MTDDINYLAKIRSGEIGLVNVPRKFKTYTICFAAVSVNGMDLYHVPNHLRSDAIYYASVYQNTQSLKFFDKGLLTKSPDILIMAVSRKADIFKWVVANIPEVITYQMCLRAVKGSGSVLKYVPAHFIDNDLVKAAVLSDGSAIHGLFAYQRPEILEAVKAISSEIPLKHLPDHFKTYPICLEQVSKQGRQLRYVPDSFVDETMVEAALTSNPWAIEYVPIFLKNLPCVVRIVRSKLVPDVLADLEGEQLLV